MALPDEASSAGDDAAQPADGGWGFSAPPFDAAQALLQLRRSLRDLRPLTERAEPPCEFLLRGQAVVRLQLAEDTAIAARLARKPARSPEWLQHTLRSAADTRQFTEKVRRALATWTED
jgi:hypothetical protein